MSARYLSIILVTERNALDPRLNENSLCSGAQLMLAGSELAVDRRVRPHPLPGCVNGTRPVMPPILPATTASSSTRSGMVPWGVTRRS